jgi:hypothetical protein
MSPRAFFLTALFFCGTWMTAHARLGDTQDQLTARYGKGSVVGKGVLFFQAQNWTITVWLTDGVSVAERYQNKTGLTDEDIAGLLSVNSQGHTWKVKPVEHSLVGTFIPMADPMGKSWVRDDGALAFVPPVAYCLTIKSKQVLDAETAKEAADKKARESSIRGF